jgi:hypothetical protein
VSRKHHRDDDFRSTAWQKPSEPRDEISRGASGAPSLARHCSPGYAGTLGGAKLYGAFQSGKNLLHFGSSDFQGKLAIGKRKFQRRDPDTRFSKRLQANCVGRSRRLDNSGSLAAADQARPRRKS